MVRGLVLVAAIWFSIPFVTGHADPLLRVNYIHTSVPTRFTISGTTMYSDVVHAWAFPPNANPVFLGAGYTSQPDIHLQRPDGAFTIIIDDEKMPLGTYPMVVYAHDPATNTFPTQAGQTITVRICDWVTEPVWFTGPLGPVTQSFQVCR